MTPQISSGNPYDAGSAGSGIGAVYSGDDNTYDKVMGAFNSAYTQSHQYAKDQEAAALAKSKVLSKMFEDLDLDTKGINPNHAQYFMEAKKRLNDFTVDSYNNNADPTSPKFQSEYAKMNGAKKAYETMINVSTAHQKSIADQYKILDNDKKGDYDFVKSAEALKADSTKPIELIAKNGLQNSLIKSQFDADHYYDQQLKNGGVFFRPDIRVETDAKGVRTSIRDFGKDNADPKYEFPAEDKDNPYTFHFDPATGLKPRILTGVQSMINTNPKFKKYIMDKWESMPEGQKDNFIRAATAFTSNGIPTNGEDLIAYDEMTPRLHRDVKITGDTPQAKDFSKASAHIYQKAHEQQDVYAPSVDRMQQVVAGADQAYYTDNADGLKHLTNLTSMPPKTYDVQVKDGNGKTTLQKVPANIIDVKHLGFTPQDGRPIMFAKDEYSARHPNNPIIGTDANGYYNVQADDIVPQIFQKEYGKDWPKVYNAWKVANQADKATVGGGATNGKILQEKYQKQMGFKAVDIKSEAEKANEIQGGEAQKKTIIGKLSDQLTKLMPFLAPPQTAPTNSPPEMIKVRVKSGPGKGKVGSIPKDKFDEALFEKI